MTVDRAQVKQGMEAVHDQGFRVSRPYLPDLYLPTAVVHEVIGRQVRFGIPDNEVDYVDWPSPPVGDVWPDV
ncbi:MAG TPA: hypothetical protein VFS96_07235 [Nitrolancea sp.]|nr:hypothetical protein [Nitrolancea sp.]